MKTMIATMGALALLTTSTVAAAASPVRAGSSLPAASATSVDSLAFSRAAVQQSDDSELRRTKNAKFPLFALLGIGAVVVVIIVIAASSGNGNGNSPG